MVQLQESVSREIREIRMGLIDVGKIEISDPYAIKKLEAKMACINDEITFKALENNRALKEGKERPFDPQEILNLRSRKEKIEKRINEFKYLIKESRKGISTNLFKVDLYPDRGLIVLNDDKNIIRANINLSRDLREHHVRWSNIKKRFQCKLNVKNLVGIKNVIKKYEAKYSASYKRK